MECIVEKISGLQVEDGPTLKMDPNADIWADEVGPEDGLMGSEAPNADHLTEDERAFSMPATSSSLF